MKKIKLIDGRLQFEKHEEAEYGYYDERKFNKDNKTISHCYGNYSLSDYVLDENFKVWRVIKHTTCIRGFYQTRVEPAKKITKRINDELIKNLDKDLIEFVFEYPEFKTAVLSEMSTLNIQTSDFNSDEFSYMLDSNKDNILYSMDFNGHTLTIEVETKDTVLVYQFGLID